MNEPSLNVSLDPIYSEEDFAQIDPKLVPYHLAIIMDGNRRWAKQQDYPLEVGHWQGSERLDCIVRAATELGIKVVTTYAFSTENWRRSQEEVAMLMQILEAYLINKRERLVKEGVRLHAIGDLSKLPANIIEALRETLEATEKCDKIDLVIAINYGGRDEICRSFKKIAERIQAGELDPEDISEQLVTEHLDTAKWPEPDLVIRTSGESRMSNFLTWQAAYSEIFVTNILWPEFSERNLFEAILEFQKRNRRFGE